MEDIVEGCGRIQEYVKGFDFDVFEADRRTVDAVIRNLEVIGEASRALPEDVKKTATDVEWRKISGLRNILVHEYFGVSTRILWDIVQNKVGLLEATCRRLLQDLPDEDNG